MYRIAPSILEANFTNLKKDLDCLKAAQVEYIHLDVMDGLFVPNLSIGITVIKGIRDASDLIFDVHMMVEEPIRFVNMLKDAGTDIVSVHYEACSDLKMTLLKIKETGMKAGIVLKPETPIAVLNKELLQITDVVQLMCVNPGIPNQKFIEASLLKIRELKNRLYKLELERDIQVDGDITVDNVKEVIQAGANIIVSGKGIFTGNILENVEKFRIYMKAEEKA